MPCKEYFREYTTKYKLPLNHRNINKVEYLRRTLYTAWKYHLTMGNLVVEDVLFRKIVYDAIYDGLKNEYGKNHHKDFLKEYEEFNRYFYEKYPELAEKIQDWENYRRSKNYQDFLDVVYTMKRLDHRLQTTTDMALAYMYAKYQRGWNIATKITDLEKTLKLDIIPKLWSKKWLWFATTLLVFDANNLYAKTLGNNQVKIIDYDAAKGEAVKIHITPWYERKDLEVGDYWKTMFRVYDEIVVPLMGEVGSVLLAEATKRGTVTALIHTARALTSIARYSRVLRGLTWAAGLAGALSGILETSILAWLGWQIVVEWSLDATIQAFFQEALKYVYAGLTGKQVWKPRNWVDWGLFEWAVWYTVKKYMNGKLDPDEQDLINFIYQYGSEKQKDILNRITRVFQYAQEVYNLKKRYTQDLRYYRDRLRDYSVIAIKSGHRWKIQDVDWLSFNAGLDIMSDIWRADIWEAERIINQKGIETIPTDRFIEGIYIDEKIINSVINEIREAYKKQSEEEKCTGYEKILMWGEKGDIRELRYGPCHIRFWRAIGSFRGSDDPAWWIYMHFWHKPYKLFETVEGSLGNAFKDREDIIFCSNRYLRDIISIVADKVNSQIKINTDLRTKPIKLFLRIYRGKNKECYAVIYYRRQVKKVIINDPAQIKETYWRMKRELYGGTEYLFGAYHYEIREGEAVPIKDYERIFNTKTGTLYLKDTSIMITEEVGHSFKMRIYNLECYSGAPSRCFESERTIYIPLDPYPKKIQYKKSKRSKIVCFPVSR